MVRAVAFNRRCGGDVTSPDQRLLLAPPRNPARTRACRRRRRPRELDLSTVSFALPGRRSDRHVCGRVGNSRVRNSTRQGMKLRRRSTSSGHQWWWEKHYFSVPCMTISSRPMKSTFPSRETGRYRSDSQRHDSLLMVSRSTTHGRYDPWKIDPHRIEPAVPVSSRGGRCPTCGEEPPGCAAGGGATPQILKNGWNARASLA